MSVEQAYAKRKAKLLNDPAVAPANRELFAKFLEYEEYKLKRTNGVAALDEHSFRTLAAYIARLRTVNRWFNGKAWKSLTRADIQRVYDDLEDGRIKTLRGEPVKDRQSYYNRIMKGKPFELAGKAKIAREVTAFYRSNGNQEVRFIPEATFRQIVEVMVQPEHRLLAWLAFDIGENATSLLALRRCDCTRQVNSDTGAPEYRVNLRRETLKRSRRARSELTNYPETVAQLDLLLANLRDDQPLFNFGVAQAAKMLRRAVKITGARCQPAGQIVTLKDLRSSMACDLLSKGWTSDEVNSRLGHKPSSRELDKYINFLALDGQRPKRKLEEHRVERLTSELDQVKSHERLMMQRQENLQAEVERLQVQLAESNRRVFEEVQRLVKTHFGNAKKAA